MNPMNGNRRACSGGRGNMRFMPMDRSDGAAQTPWLRLDNSGNQGQVQGGGCCSCNDGCGGDEYASCKQLLEKLRLLDFSLCEVVLYLDAYPDSCEALALYHHLLAERQEVLELYEAAGGPLTVGGNHSHTSWDWFKGPFPWEYEAN